MRIAIGSDHAGFELKIVLARMLRADGQEILEVTLPRLDPNDDYPDAAAAVGRAVIAGKAERGILICGSGVGAAVAANKIKGVRAGQCHDTYSAHQGVEHDDINVICLGARIIGKSTAHELLRAFLGARFTGEERHVRRRNKTMALEKGNG